MSILGCRTPLGFTLPPHLQLVISQSATTSTFVCRNPGCASHCSICDNYVKLRPICFTPSRENLVAGVDCDLRLVNLDRIVASPSVRSRVTVASCDELRPRRRRFARPIARPDASRKFLPRRRQFVCAITRDYPSSSPPRSRRVGRAVRVSGGGGRRRRRTPPAAAPA